MGAPAGVWGCVPGAVARKACRLTARVLASRLVLRRVVCGRRLLEKAKRLRRPPGLLWERLLLVLRRLGPGLTGPARQEVQLHLRRQRLGRLLRPGLAFQQGLGQQARLDPGVVGGGEHLVGELADVLDQALALLPQRRVSTITCSGTSPASRRVVSASVRRRGAALGARDGGDLVACLVHARWRIPAVSSPTWSTPAGSRLAALQALQLPDQLGHLLDGRRRPPVPVSSAHRDGEGPLPDLVGYGRPAQVLCRKLVRV